MSTERPVSRREFYAAITGMFALVLAVLSVTASEELWQRSALSTVCALGLLVYGVLTLMAKRRSGAGASE